MRKIEEKAFWCLERLWPKPERYMYFVCTSISAQKATQCLGFGLHPVVSTLQERNQGRCDDPGGLFAHFLLHFCEFFLSFFTKNCSHPKQYLDSLDECTSVCKFHFPQPTAGAARRNTVHSVATANHKFWVENLTEMLAWVFDSELKPAHVLRCENPAE